MSKGLLKERTSKGEKIGGGYFVMARHKGTGRVLASPSGVPFEHPDRGSAEREMLRLAGLHTGTTFCVFEEVTDCKYKDAEPAAPPSVDTP